MVKMGNQYDPAVALKICPSPVNPLIFIGYSCPLTLKLTTGPKNKLAVNSMARNRNTD